jgi:hypothetical protein
VAGDEGIDGFREAGGGGESREAEDGGASRKAAVGEDDGGGGGGGHDDDDGGGLGTKKWLSVGGGRVVSFIYRHTISPGSCNEP